MLDLVQFLRVIILAQSMGEKVIHCRFRGQNVNLSVEKLVAALKGTSRFTLAYLIIEARMDYME